MSAWKILAWCAFSLAACAAPLGDGTSAPGPAPPEGGAAPRDLAIDADRPLKQILDEAAERIEREAIRAALRAEEGSPTRAAKRLGISRAAFYNKVKRHGIDI